LHPRIFKDCPAGAFSMNVIYNRYQRDPGGWFDGIGFVIHEGHWLHVGDPAARDAAQIYIQQLTQ